MAISSQLRHVVRRLGRAPLFTSVTVATLAIPPLRLFRFVGPGFLETRSE